MQRTRQRIEPHPQVVYRDYSWDKSTSPWTATENLINLGVNLSLNGLPHRIETMIDEVGDPLDGSLGYWLNKLAPSELQRRTSFKECEHTYQTNEFDTVMRGKRFDSVCASSSAVKRLRPSHLELARVLMPVPDYDLDALASQAMAFMLPALNQGTSVLNFAAELHELKSLDPRYSLKRIRHGATTLKALSDRKTRSGFIKDTTRRLASAHLQAEFGIVPFVKDIVQMHDDLVALGHRLDVLKQHANKPLTRHYKRVLPYESGKFYSRGQSAQFVVDVSGNILDTPFYDALLGGYPDRDGDGVFLDLRKVWVSRPTYHATLRYRYTLPQFDSETEEKIAAHLEVLGVRMDPSIVWNATRLTFLVDWVVDVSGFLSNFAKDTYEIKTEVIEFCHSVGWHSECFGAIKERYRDASVKTAFLPAPSANTEPMTTVPVWYGVDRYYRRVRASPDANPTQSKRATLRKTALAGSLIVANLPSLRRGRHIYLRGLPEH